MNFNYQFNLYFIITFCSAFVQAKYYYWFNIVSDLLVGGYRLAVDIEYGNKSNCPGANLVLCPWDKDKPGQIWRWEGSMLKSRENGLVWELVINVTYSVKLNWPTSSWKQQFHYYYSGRYIYPDIKRFEDKQVVEVECHGPPTFCSYLRLGQLSDPLTCFSNNRAFSFMEILMPYQLQLNTAANTVL